MQPTQPTAMSDSESHKLESRRGGPWCKCRGPSSMYECKNQKGCSGQPTTPDFCDSCKIYCSPGGYLYPQNEFYQKYEKIREEREAAAKAAAANVVDDGGQGSGDKKTEKQPEENDVPNSQRKEARAASHDSLAGEDVDMMSSGHKQDDHGVDNEGLKDTGGGGLREEKIVGM